MNASSPLRISALIHARVYDADGHHVGRVHDVVARHAGPPAGEQGLHGLTPAWLVVAPAGLLERLGLARSHPPRPRLVQWLLRKERAVDWDDVVSVDANCIRLAVPADRLVNRAG